MTNREYLNTLSNEEFARLVSKETDGTGLDFEKWLEGEHREAKKVSLKKLKAGTKFKFAGHEFTKLADEEKSCYCFLDEAIFESEFGETNDWATSPIRARLNVFDESGNSKAISGIKEEDLVAVSLNYYAYNIPNGRTSDKITLLSWEEWYTYKFNLDIDLEGYGTWLRSGSNAYASLAYRLKTSGDYYNGLVRRGYAARPALHFRADLEVEVDE